MIGKIVTGKSFRGCLNYLHEGRLQENEAQQRQEMEKKQAQVIAYNQCFGNKKELTRQFIEVSKLNPKVSKPVFHLTVSLAHADAGKLNNQQKADIAASLAKEFEFDRNQYVVVTHADTEHEHLHIVANRTGYDGKTASDSNSYQRVAKTCRKMELAYGLEKVLSPNKFLKLEQRVAQSQRIDQRKEVLKKHLSKAIKRCKDVQQVKQYMEDRGYKVEQGRGIAFIDQQRVYFKGSQLGYSLQTIENKLKQEQQLKEQLKQQQQQLKQIREQKHDRSHAMHM
jgi:hypothetical protein